MVGNKVFSTLNPAYINQLNHSLSTTDKKKYLSMPFSVNGEEGTAFIDSGCTFNAISAVFATRCNQTIQDTQEQIQITIGGGQTMQITRRITEILFDLGNLGPFDTKVFVMDHIPLQCDAIFGMEFLEHFNPSICWKEKTVIATQPSSVPTDHNEDAHMAHMCYYLHNDHVSSSGITRFVNNGPLLDQELKALNMASIDTFCFLSIQWLTNPKKSNASKSKTGTICALTQLIRF